MTGEEKDAFQRAYVAALRLLSLCDRSKNDLQERLSRKGYSPEVIEGVISRLESMDHIDDGRFALKFALDAARRKNVGPEAIRYGLQQKGISREIIDGTVSKVFQDMDEKEVAMRALRKRHPHPVPPPQREREKGRGSQVGKDEIKRLSDHLRRKGFSYDIIREALKEIGKEDDV